MHTPPDSNKSGVGCAHDSTDTRLNSGATSTFHSNFISGSNNSSAMSLKQSCSVSSNNSNCNRSVGVLRPEELSKMFPTPPSMEHNPVASPCQLNDPSLEQIELGISQRQLQQHKLIERRLHEIYPNMGSPLEENIEDWSYVFKPPTMCKLVGSSKYAPLTNLPSLSFPPITLPSNSVYRISSWTCNNANQK